MFLIGVVYVRFICRTFFYMKFIGRPFFYVSCTCRTVFGLLLQ